MCFDCVGLVCLNVWMGYSLRGSMCRSVGEVSLGETQHVLLILRGEPNLAMLFMMSRTMF